MLISGDIQLLADLLTEGVYDPAQIDPLVLPRVLNVIAARERAKQAGAAERLAARIAEDEARAVNRVRPARDANAWTDE